jgi:hypothetical protein
MNHAQAWAGGAAVEGELDELLIRSTSARTCPRFALEIRRLNSGGSWLMSAATIPISTP